MKTGLPGRAFAYALLLCLSCASVSCAFFGWDAAARGKGDIVVSLNFPAIPGELAGARPAGSLGASRVLDPGTTTIKATVSGPGMDPVVQTFSHTIGNTSASVTILGILAGANRRVDVEVLNPGGSYGSGYATGVTVTQAGPNGASVLILPSSPVSWSAPRLVLAGQANRTAFAQTRPFPQTGAYTITIDQDATNPFTGAYLWMDDGSLSGSSYDSLTKSFQIPSASAGDQYFLGLYNNDASPGSHSLAEYRSLAGSPETAFGPQGARFASFATGVPSTVIYKAARQADGKIVFVGCIDEGGDSDVFVSRYTSDGFVDTSFGAGRGWVTIDAGTVTDYGYAIAIDGGGGIVVAGSSGNNFLAARLLDNGSLDPSFGTNGVWVFPIQVSGEARAIAIDSVGRIILGGTSNDGVNPYCTLACLSALGTLDLSFDFDGYAYIGSGTDATVFALAVDVYQNIWSAGIRGTDCFLALTDSSGGLMSGPTGFVSGAGYWTGSPGGGGCFNAVSLTNGGVGEYQVVAGGYELGAGTRMALARFNPGTAINNPAGAGGLDTGFGTSGWRTLFTFSDIATINDLQVKVGAPYDGYIMAYGQVLAPNPLSHAVVARFTPAGALDTPTFNGSGYRTFGAGSLGGNSHYYAVSGFHEPSGDSFMAVAAHVDQSATHSVPGIIRILASGAEGVAADATAFSGDGYAVENFVPTAEARFLATAVQDDGKILAAGWRQDIGKVGIVMRYNADGSVDGSFGTGGVWSLGGLGDFTVDAMRYLPDSGGRILVAGRYGNSGGITRVFVSALDSSGGSIPGFGTNSGYTFDPIGATGNTATVKDLDVDPATGAIFAVGWETSSGSVVTPITLTMNSSGLSPSFNSIGGYVGTKLRGVRFVDSATVLAVGDQPQAKQTAMGFTFALASPGVVAGVQSFIDMGMDRYLTGLAKTRDGSFYACGYANDGIPNKLLGIVLKLTVSGANPAIDASVWSGTGKAYFNAEGGQRDQILSIAAHPDGELLIAGCSLVDNNHKSYVARIDAVAGGIDMSFNGGTGYCFLPNPRAAVYTYPGGPQSAAFESVAVGLESAATVGWMLGSEGTYGPVAMAVR
jgi:uncharacterized delta-60 repeat protein